MNGLLKACELRQEKPSSCHKNGAASNPHIDNPGQTHPFGSNFFFFSPVLNLDRPVLDLSIPLVDQRPKIKLTLTTTKKRDL
jgi:hypothetical protein